MSRHRLDTAEYDAMLRGMHEVSVQLTISQNAWRDLRDNAFRMPGSPSPLAVPTPEPGTAMAEAVAELVDLGALRPSPVASAWLLVTDVGQRILELPEPIEPREKPPLCSEVRLEDINIPPRVRETDLVLLREHIRNHGLKCPPILMYARIGRYSVVSGVDRLHALREIGVKRVWALLA